MIRVGVGYSTLPDTVTAAKEAVRMALSRAQTDRADFTLAFATTTHSPDYPRLLATLLKETQSPALIGASALGILTQDGEIEDDPGLAVMTIRSDQLTAKPFLLTGLKGNCREIGQNIGRHIRTGINPSSLLMVLPDTFSFDPDAFFKGIQEIVSFIPIIGGGCSENGTQRRTYQFSGERAETNSVCGALLSGRFHHNIGFSQACQPLGEPMVVTQARGNKILELAGKPAHAAFCELFSEPVDFETAASMVFLGLPVDLTQTRLERGNYLVRNIISINPARGSLTVAAPIVKGQVVSFTLRDPERAQEDMELTLEDLARRQNGRRPAFALYFDCCARGTSLYGKGGVDVDLFKRYLGDIPLMGFYTYAEIAPIRRANYLHNYSGVLLLVSEN